MFKALNTVLAFCSSRKNLAVTFPAIKTSVENILNKPLEMHQVAEIKPVNLQLVSLALLPDLVQFAYIPADDHRINESDSTSRHHQGSSSDIYGPKGEEEDHVLVMEFVENVKNNRAKKNSVGLTAPPSLSPLAVKNLIEKRNSRFSTSVNELILACQASGEDPVALLRNAGAEHIPVNPSASSPAVSTSIALARLDVPERVPTPSSRPSIVSLIEEIQQSDSYRGQICYRQIFEERAAQNKTLSKPLSQDLAQALRELRGVNGFYAHQADAINAFWAGRHVVVSTSTASGKSLIYQVPILTALENDNEATAIFIYPTKALAQDQKNSLQQLLARCESIQQLRIETYDGDTPQDKRRDIRENAAIIFTNFDTLSASILPNEDRWRRFLKSMKLVAVDELHYYHGLMGSHVALVMRRLRRVCAAVGNRRVQFVSCTATISNPKEHMQNIFGVDNVEVLTNDGAPAGRKDFLIWEPPLVDDQVPELGRVKSMAEGSAVTVFLMKRGVRTIVFCKTRRSCELFLKSVRANLLAEGRTDISNKIRAYRGGYSKEDRRRIEQEAFSGELLGIVATNALELGVDIGSLDAVVTLGFPFNVASFRQQSGRAGRRSRDSISILISDSLAIDKHFIENPEEIFDHPMEDLVIDTENTVILESHVQCAAHEMPIDPGRDEIYFGHNLKALCADRLEKDSDGWYHTHPKFLPHPAKYVALRGAREDKYTVVDMSNKSRPGGKSRILEEIEVSRALFEAYEGGVFMHQGMTFIVKEVSHDERTAKVIRSDVNWTTRPRDFTNIDPTHTYRIREIRGSPVLAYFGRIEIVTVVFGFFKIRHNVILDTVQLETPPFERESTGMWVDIPKHCVDLLFRKGRNPAEGIHSAQHAVLSLTPLYSMSTKGDVKTECKSPEKENSVRESKRKRPARLIFYDAAGTGSGVCAKAFDHIGDLLGQALSVIENCSCMEDEGCDKCIKMTTCKEANIVASKVGAKVTYSLEDELGSDLPADEGILETVKVATPVRAVDAVSIERD
ncbi:P-loop containing nucleoside triphosphate hydrolase protein [Cantharellus anzutake]|uniref:P-loop containing nucleoside triphosphate hydrolase protein n=1 Tax=Cantharellus anzutake TaxID=1750568 RepID=UPI001904285C|nr:P-loop containing nucleoside triphosphate hydrolase protein [Cantharellus anzutake]KAF8323509.1 P-loop containing nucleoside triphosphate hydrolase protein [Cantharellus anzutake]